MPKPSSSVSNRKTTGNRGEKAAVEYLRAHGYSIMDTNVRPFGGMQRGEIDIVAADHLCICFVEVKSSTSLKADPLENVTLAKRRQLIRLAEAYIQLRNVADDVEIRFDVVSVTIPKNTGAPQITLIKNAFWPE